MLFATWADRPHRPTKDLDLLGYGDASVEQFRHIITQICQTKVETKKRMAFILEYC